MFAPKCIPKVDFYFGIFLLIDFYFFQIIVTYSEGCFAGNYFTPFNLFNLICFILFYIIFLYLNPFKRFQFILFVHYSLPSVLLCPLFNEGKTLLPGVCAVSLQCSILNLLLTDVVKGEIGTTNKTLLLYVEFNL